MNEQGARLLYPYFGQGLFEAFAGGLSEEPTEGAVRHRELFRDLSCREVVLELSLDDLVNLFYPPGVDGIDGKKILCLQVFPIVLLQRHFPQNGKEMHQPLKGMGVEHFFHLFTDAMLVLSGDRDAGLGDGEKAGDPAEFGKAVGYGFELASFELDDVFFIVYRFISKVEGIVRNVWPQQHEVSVVKTADPAAYETFAFSMRQVDDLEFRMEMPEVLVAKKGLLVVGHIEGGAVDGVYFLEIGFFHFCLSRWALYEDNLVQLLEKGLK